MFKRTLLLVMLLSFCLAVFAQDSALIVVNKSEDTIAVVDPATLKVIRKVPTGHAPHEVAAGADGRLVYVANYGTAPEAGTSLSVIDWRAGKEVARIQLPGLARPHGIREAGGAIFFTTEGSRTVNRLNVSTNQVDWLTGTGQAVTHMVVVTKDGKKLYTANIGSDTVTSVVIGNQNASQGVTQIVVGKGPEGIDISPDGRELWVAHRADGGVSIIDPTTDKVKETFQIGKMPIRVKFTPDGKRVLISDANANELIIVDAATRKELKRIPVGAVPVGIQITPDGHRAFVANTAANRVSIFDLDRMELLPQALEPGKEPDGMTWVGK